MILKYMLLYYIIMHITCKKPKVKNFKQIYNNYRNFIVFCFLNLRFILIWRKEIVKARVKNCTVLPPPLALSGRP